MARRVGKYPDRVTAQTSGQATIYMGASSRIVLDFPFAGAGFLGFNTDIHYATGLQTAGGLACYIYIHINYVVSDLLVSL